MYGIWIFLDILILILVVFTERSGSALIEGGANVCNIPTSREDKYHTDCGFLNWDRCTRYRTVYYFVYECCADWTQVNINAVDCAIPWCVKGWNACHNGGTCTTANYCTCPRGFYSPECDVCTSIANCDAHECSSAADQRCVTCVDEYTPQVRAYRPVDASGYQDRVCEQLCSWRADSKQCYPGKCTDGTPGSCQCAPGFTDSDCNQISNTNIPEITYCLAFIYDTRSENAELSCMDKYGPSKYTNIRAATVKVDWRTQFKGPEGTGPTGSTFPYPVWVNDFAVGIVSAQVSWTISRGAMSIANGILDCSDGISANSPDTGLRVCDEVGSISTSLMSGDMMHISPTSTNGGYVDIKGFQSALQFTTAKKNYQGQYLTHSSSFMFDFDPPYHCTTSCPYSRLFDVGPAYTREATFSLFWQDWTDDRAGVRSYQYEVYKFKALGAGDSAVLDYKTESPVAKDLYDSLPSPSPTVTLTEPGMYCVLLIVYDDTTDSVLQANHRIARRFIFYDDSTQVETSDHIDQQMVVTSAAADTSYVWITDLDQPVTLQWTNHFYNEFHRTNFLLNAIDSHSTNIDAGYEERTGQPPDIRSMEAIPNVNGIVRYDMMYATDHDGGRSITSPVHTWESVIDFQAEVDTKTIARVDGDSIRFWVNAFDVMDNSLYDDLLVHVDSSPPIIDSGGLLRDGETLLAVHSSIDLFDMVLQFDTYDYHSGMKQITWELVDMSDLTKHGDGAVPVVRSINAADPTCVAPDCYCIEKDEECFKTTYQIVPELDKLDISYGIHDGDYVFVITGVNNAMLQTVYRFQITIDVSLPLTGHVFDAELGNIDIDYQSDPVVHSSWNGFFDRESGIKYYKYATYTSCLTVSDFESGGSQASERIVTTSNTFGSESMTEDGTYYTTVVAYNHALEPSHPVCSDGVTIDTTPPEIGSIHVSYAYNKPGLVSDGQKMMFLDEEGYVYELAEPTDNCNARRLTTLSLFEGRTFTDPLEPNQDNCSSYTAAGSTHYLAAENMFELTWSGTDTESTIHDYMIALSSTETPSGDTMPFISSHGKEYFITYHPNLVNFEEVYVNIKAINKAGLEATQTFGPVVVRGSGPAFDGEITILYHKEAGDFLVASFGEAPYDIDDVNKDYLESVEYSLGEGACTGDIISWTVIDNPVNSFGCDNSWPQLCVLIDPAVQGFHLHHNTDYCLSVRLQAYNKRVTSRTGWYTHTKATVSTGMLWEINTTGDDLVKKDIDFQTSTEAVSLRFLSTTSKTDDTVEYLVGVGTTPGDDNIKAFATVDITNIIDVGGLMLELNTKYYTVLKAVDMNAEDYSLVTSDGFMVLPVNTEIPSLMVYDGVLCTSDELAETLSHHDNITDLPSCGVDIDYQIYTTAFSVYWTYEATGLYIQYFGISVEKQIQSNDLVSWESVLSDYVVGHENTAHVTGLYLEAGQTYRVSLQPCHPAGCYTPTTTNGVMITPTQPVAKEILDVVYNDSDTFISVRWNAFADAYHGMNFDIISQYAIAIFVRPDYTANTDQITKWTHLQMGDYDIDPDTKQINTTYTLEHHLEASCCLVLAVRGYNRAMLYSTTYKEFTGCTVPERYQLLVLDAVGEMTDGTTDDISFVTNEAWTHPEAEYTQSRTSVAAVWPTLKHSFTRWSVVHGDSVNRMAYKGTITDHLSYLDFECGSPEVLACGDTNDRYVNVHNLALEEGLRYHVCIYAVEAIIEHEKWNETLPEVSVCSNGVTVDTEHPIGGSVSIGNGHVQSDNLVLVTQWNSFLDIEVSGRTAHHSGIKTYFLAIGSSHGGQDVLDFQDVGLTNIKVVTGLSLKNGGVYYATIKAQDHVGLETSVTSEEMTIDMTHPVVSNNKLTVSGSFLSAENSIQLMYLNGAFVDPESGISGYVWCIGSRPSLCDTLARTEVTTPVLSVTSNVAQFIDGQEYHVLLEAYNGAGLSVSTTAATFVVDISGPLLGFVHEVQPDSAQDIDYQVSNKEVHLVWGDFSDPESPILEYRLSIGSCQGCTDVLNDVYVGLVEAYQLYHLQLRHGVEYFTQIKACNSAGLCTVTTSDGIVIDSTPPYLGHVLDGLYGGDKDYHSTNNLVQAHLENVHDMQSDLSITSWWAGTSAGDTDIFTEEITHSHTVLQKSLDTDLSDGTMVYVTVKVCNKAGLCTTKSSDGSTIDSSPPTVIADIEPVPTIGRLVSGYQIYRNTLALQWSASDDGSPVVSTYLSLLPQNDAHLIVPCVKLMGNPESYILSDLDLRDGDVYVAKVTVCNAVNLCSDSTSSDLKVDSSPSTSGAFAVETEHAVDLSRQRDGWMTYDNNGAVVKLAWVGFQDPHSDVQEYRVKIGTEFYTADIGDQTIAHQSTDAHRDEGLVVTETLSITRTLAANEDIYISISATNTAGLQSTILHGLFTTVSSGGDTGILELDRRCAVLSCVGHCTCAPHGFHGCDITGDTCTDRTGEAGYATVTVYDIIPSTESDPVVTDVDFIPSLHILQADWVLAENQINPSYYDWSVGVKDETPGGGVLDINAQPVWHEAGTDTEALFSMANSKLTDALSPHVTYVFYVKAWYDANNYAIFQSDGVQVDSTAPELSDSYSVIEATESDPPTSSADVDFTASATEIKVKWDNAFIDSQSGFESFDVMIYSNKILSVIASTRVDGDTEEFTFSGLSLAQGEHYVSKVLACNKADLCTEASSDGFLLDKTPPQPGSVLDGGGFHDIEYSSTTQVAASWHGFYDDESFIDHYVWCYSVEEVEIECNEVGLYQQQEATLPGDIQNGEIVHATVFAVNAAGLSSTVVLSNGFIFDSTAPINTHYFTFGGNIVLNSDFESGTDNWELDAEHTNEDNDNALCVLNGFFKQTLTTVEFQKYRLQFDAFSGLESEHSASLGYVHFGQKEHHGISAAAMNDDLHLRHKVFFITAHSTSSPLEFGTMTDSMLCIGNILLEPITEGLRQAEHPEHPEAGFSGSVHVHVKASDMGTTVVLNWDFEDPESAVVDYMFAVGTVQGGIQLQDFKSTGTTSSGTLSGVKVQHGTTLYSTVVATNAAGMSVVVHADPVIVDLTTPVIDVFQVNSGNLVLPTPVLNVNWEARDPESGLETCEFSIENHNDATFEFTTLLWPASGTNVVSLTDINNGDTISCKLMCKSFKNLYTEEIVGPYTYVTQASNTDSANMYVIPSSDTYYSVQDNYLPTADMVWFRWDGIVDPVGIQYCEVLVSDGASNVVETISLGTNQHSIAVLQNTSTLLQENIPYTVQLVCVNRGGYASQPVIKEFHIDSSLPAYTGETLGIFWSSDTKVQLNWSGLFTAQTELIYELNLGTTAGGIDVLSWLETKDTEIEITDIKSSLTHYLSISAISRNGLYVTSTFIVRY